MLDIKLQAYLAHAGVASRRKSEELITAGKVTVNGKQAHIGQRINPGIDKVEVGSRKICNPLQKIYLVLNKPRGIVSTTDDELGRKHVLDLLPANQRQGMYPVGRLDKDSEGLILLTNDGELSYILTHPKFEIEKTYHVLLKGIPSTPALDHLNRGVKLQDQYIKPVKTMLIKHENGNTWLEVVIKEGQKHQVRKMMARIGYDVVRLVRVQMGPIKLEDLKQGTTREATKVELEQLEHIKKTYQS